MNRPNAGGAPAPANPDARARDAAPPDPGRSCAPARANARMTACRWCGGGGVRVAVDTTGGPRPHARGYERCPCARARAAARVTAADANALLRSLWEAARDGRTLPWCVEHAAAGDPVPAAWAAATDPCALRAAVFAARGGWLRAHAALRGTSARARTSIDRDDAAACDEIRAAVPPPSLADVLAAARGRRL